MARYPATGRQAAGWAVVVTIGALLASAGIVYVQTRLPTIIVVLGPAEAEDSGRPNPGLSAKGAGRARELVRAIGELPLDDGVAALFATRYRASQETARPLAQHLDLPVQIVDAADHDPLLQRIATRYQGQVLIVVTDADALAALLGGLLRRAFTVHDPAVDRLYLVTVPRIGAPSAVALRYGAPAATSTGS